MATCFRDIPLPRRSVGLLHGTSSARRVHVRDAEYKAKINILTLDVMTGNLRKSRLALASEWIADNEDFLLAEWKKWCTK